MSIQDNPRYKRLVEAGMPRFNIFVHNGPSEHGLSIDHRTLKKLRYTWQAHVDFPIIKYKWGRNLMWTFKCGGCSGPEVIDKLFSMLEDHYGSIHQ